MSFSDRNTNKVIVNQMKPQKLYYYTKASMSEDEYREVSYELLDLILDDEVYVREDFFEDLPERWKRISAFVKRYDFNQESEYRLVFNRKQLESEPKIEYRMDKQVLKPYIDVEVENGWPIEEITIGPGFNQDIVYVSIQHFLNNAEIKNGIVTKGDFCRRIEEYLNYDNKIFEENIWELNSVKNIKYNLDNETENHEQITLGERHFLRNLVDLTVAEIIEAGKTNREYERVKYYQDNYFTNSGIILNKSSIPYIF